MSAIDPDDPLAIQILGELTANGFLIEIILANLIAAIDPEKRDRFIADLLKVSKRMDRAKTDDPVDAVRTSDVMLHAQERIEAKIAGALARVGKQPG